MASVVSPGRRSAARQSPFDAYDRSSMSPSPMGSGRPQSAVFQRTMSPSPIPAHARNETLSPIGSGPLLARTTSKRLRSNSLRNISNSSGTFAPKFIKSEEAAKPNHAEGDTDFSGKRHVWLRDEEKYFERAVVVEEKPGGILLVQSDDGSVSNTPCACYSWPRLTTHGSIAKRSRSGKRRPSKSRQV